MNKQYLIISCLLAGLIFTLACASPDTKSLLIKGIVHAQEVFASFETPLSYQPAATDNNQLKYSWSAEDGTIIGEGRNVRWIAPAVPGKYDVRVKVIDSTGNEDFNRISIKVEPFTDADIKLSPDIVLNLTPGASSFYSERVTMRPATTAEISCMIPGNNQTSIKYYWSCNGGKLVGKGLKEGAADKIGWTSPGIGGNYTIHLTAVDNQGNCSRACVYVYIKMPYCGENGEPCKIVEQP